MTFIYFLLFVIVVGAIGFSLSKKQTQGSPIRQKYAEKIFKEIIANPQTIEQNLIKKDPNGFIFFAKFFEARIRYGETKPVYVTEEDYYRQRYEQAHSYGLALKGNEIPTIEILKSLRLKKELNQLADKSFSRINDAVEYLSQLPDINSRLDKISARNNYFQLKNVTLDMKYLYNQDEKIDRTCDAYKSDYPPPKKRFSPPSSTKIELCKRLGLQINPTMNYLEVNKIIEDAKKDPKIKLLYDEYTAEKEKHNAEQNAIVDAEEREECGDDLVDERNKWEKIGSHRVQHIVVFKKGKTLDADILEFEGASIKKNESKYYVEINGLRPKIHKSRNEFPYVEWEKEITLRPDQIIEVVTLPKQIDLFEIDEYENALNRAKILKEKYE